MTYNIIDNNIQHFKRYYWVLSGISDKNFIDYIDMKSSLDTAFNARMGSLWITRLALPIMSLMTIIVVFLGSASLIAISVGVLLGLVLSWIVASLVHYSEMKTVRYYSNLYWDSRVVPEGKED